MTVDRNRNYYVATRGSTQPAPVKQICWQQPKDDMDAAAVRENIELERPEAVNLFHEFGSWIDRHNASRQEMLGLETTWKTQNWHIRCNMTMLAVSIVDSMLMYEAATDTQWKHGKYFSKLAEQLIDNNWDEHLGMLYKDMTPLKRNEEENDTGATSAAYVNDAAREALGPAFVSRNVRPHGIGLHLTPVKEKNPKTGNTWQNRCRTQGCRRQVTKECNICYALYCKNKGERFYCCSPSKSNHWNEHMQNCHGICLIIAPVDAEEEG